MFISAYQQSYLRAIAQELSSIGIGLINDLGSGESFWFEKNLDMMSNSISSHFGYSSEEDYQVRQDMHLTDWTGMLWNRESVVPMDSPQLKRPMRAITKDNANSYTTRAAGFGDITVRVKLFTNSPDYQDKVMEWFLSEGRHVTGVETAVTIDGQPLDFFCNVFMGDLSFEDDVFQDFKNPIFSVEFSARLSGLFYSPKSEEMVRIRRLIAQIFTRHHAAPGYEYQLQFRLEKDL